MWQLHLGALCAGIYKWAQSDENDKRANLIAVSEANLFSVYLLWYFVSAIYIELAHSLYLRQYNETIFGSKSFTD